MNHSTQEITMNELRTQTIALPQRGAEPSARADREPPPPAVPGWSLAKLP